MTRAEQRISLGLRVNNLARARRHEALGWSGAQQPDDEVCFFQVGRWYWPVDSSRRSRRSGIRLASQRPRSPEVHDLLAEAER
jgi:hypothetical protein